MGGYSQLVFGESNTGNIKLINFDLSKNQKMDNRAGYG
jgi:hypothetical protein